MTSKCMDPRFTFRQRNTRVEDDGGGEVGSEIRGSRMTVVGEVGSEIRGSRMKEIVIPNINILLSYKEFGIHALLLY